MRITGGTCRGRTLISPPSQAIRPTADKVRLAVFNMLESRRAVVDAVVLDACCGTGALGLEALSRGAAHTTFADNAPQSLALAAENAKAFNLTGQSDFILMDATCPPAASKAASLIFLDPPYRKNLVPVMLDALEHTGWIAPAAYAVLEVEAGFTAPATWPAGFQLDQHKAYGDTEVFILRKC